MQTFDFTIGTRVYCEDGECGRLAKVVVDPNTLQSKDIIVAEGILQDQARVVPVWAVTSTTHDQIQLAIHQGELSKYPAYHEGNYATLSDLDVETPSVSAEPSTRESPSLKRGDYEEGTLVYEKAAANGNETLSGLSRGTPIYTQDGEAGKLDSFLTDPEKNEAITHIVVRQGFLVTEYVPVPISLIQHINRDGIHLSTTKEGLVGLTRYAWPEEIGYDQEIQGDTVHSDADHILSHDLALRAIVANALSQDPQTKDAVIEVINEQGIITLVGRVANGKCRNAAAQIAAQQPGVISVTNSLKVSGQHETGDPPRDTYENRIEPLIHPYALKP